MRKNMSLRNYLFTLIGGLIILLTIAQLFLVHWIEQTLAEEVNQKAHVLSQQVIELAFEEFEQQDLHISANVIVHSATTHNTTTDKKHIKIKTNEIKETLKVITHSHSEKIQNDINHLHKQNKMQMHTEFPGNELFNKENTEQFDVTAESIDMSKHLFTQEFKTLVEKQVKRLKHTEVSELVIKTPKSKNFILFEGNTDNLVDHHTDAQLTKSQNLLNYVQLALILCAIIALVFAYWLSIKFNKPLKNLVFGFENLAKGDYESNVPETGVNEIRTTINHFNNMVKRLASLTTAEKQHKEIAHLAELGEVSRGLAHALRNPIHTIGLSLEQLSDPELSKEHRNKLIKTVQSKITNIDKNIKALLTLTTTGISRKEKIPVLPVIQDIVLEYKSCQPTPRLSKYDHFQPIYRLYFWLF